MSDKTKKITSTVLISVVSLMLSMSAVMKLAGGEEIVKGLTAAGLGPHIKFLGLLELAAVGVFIYPRTRRIGFLLLCCYLGGALSIELANSRPPSAAIFLALLWIAVYLRDKSSFMLQAGR
jgi:hypothetical protein